MRLSHTYEPATGYLASVVRDDRVELELRIGPRDLPGDTFLWRGHAAAEAEDVAGVGVHIQFDSRSYGAIGQLEIEVLAWNGRASRKELPAADATDEDLEVGNQLPGFGAPVLGLRARRLGLRHGGRDDEEPDEDKEQG